MISAGVKKSWNKIFAEKEALLEKYRKLFGNEPQGEAVTLHNFEETKNKIFAEIDKGYEGSHLDPNKTDRVLDSIVGHKETPTPTDASRFAQPKKKRGRPRGSKNKPKPQLVNPSLIGSVPGGDLIILKGG